MRLNVDYATQPDIGKGLIEDLKARVNEICGPAIKVENLYPISSSKEIMTTAELRTLQAQRWRMEDHLHTFCYEWPGFQVCLYEDAEDGLSKFCRRSATSITIPTMPCRRGISNTNNNSMVPFRDISQPLKS